MIPAIDLRGGRCVRLFQGDYARETAYSDDPVAMARHWQSLGAPRLHVVALDGARSGVPANGPIVAAICAALDIEVEVSGGIRTLEAVGAALASGAARVQLGSAAVRDPVMVASACSAYPGTIVVSIDARNGEVMTDGWIEGSGLAVLDLAQRMVEAGVPRLMFTDIARDGALGGPNVDALRDLVQALPVPVVASGGVTRIEHLRDLAAAGCEGAVVGKALYDGALDLRDALAAASAC